MKFLTLCALIGVCSAGWVWGPNAGTNCPNIDPSDIDPVAIHGDSQQIGWFSRGDDTGFEGDCNNPNGKYKFSYDGGYKAGNKLNNKLANGYSLQTNQPADGDIYSHPNSAEGCSLSHRFADCDREAANHMLDGHWIEVKVQKKLASDGTPRYCLLRVYYNATWSTGDLGCAEEGSNEGGEEGNNEGGEEGNNEGGEEGNNEGGEEGNNEGGEEGNNEGGEEGNNEGGEEGNNEGGEEGNNEGGEEGNNEGGEEGGNECTEDWNCDPLNLGTRNMVRCMNGYCKCHDSFEPYNASPTPGKFYCECPAGEDILYGETNVCMVDPYGRK